MTDAASGVPNYPLKGAGRISDINLINGGTEMQFSILGEVGKTYTVQSISSLGSSNWSDVQSVSGQGHMITITVPMSDDPEAAEFFRINIQ